jgi:hypothetical protein
MGTEAGAQAINEAYMKGASDYANKGFFDRVGGGFDALGTQVGRDAAMTQAGGGKGLFRSGLAALAPAAAAMTPEPAASPYPLMSMDIDRNVRPFQDIQAYQAPQRSYNYQGNNVYIPLSTVRAAKGGEVGFFSGGGTGQGGGILSSAVANRPFIIDPATGNVIPNPNIQRPKPKPFTNIGVAGGMGGDGGGYAPNPDFDTPEKQAAYYAERPNQANIAGIAQSLIGMTPIGAMQRYFDPEGVAAREAMFQQPPTSMVYNRSVPIDSPLGMGLGSTKFGAPSNINLGTPGASLAAAKDYAENERQLNEAMAAEVQARVGGYSDSATSQQRSDDSRDIGYEGRGTQTAEANAQAEATGGTGTGYGGDGSDFAGGGLMGLARGGMRSGGFVIPADVVAMIGEGNTDAGYERIKAVVPGATAIKGKDGGQADTVKTSIEGKQPARVAHGEMYIPPETVKRMGGAKKLYAMMDRVRQQATGSKKQIKPVNLKRVMA